MKKIEIIALKVEKREYFCIVKHLKGIFSRLTFGIILIISSAFYAHGQTNQDMADSIEISLLTCSPHNEVYSIYGHTAIRYVDKTNKVDLTFNFGIFDFKKPYFVLRFLFGLTDYQLGILPYNLFEEVYRRENRQVSEQVLNLTREEKLRVYKALYENYLPENREYRYNFIYNNCTTKARDLLASCINGEICYKERAETSLREQIHVFTKDYPWIEFGNDLCLGFKADLTANLSDTQFLPYNLMHDFNGASIKTGNSTRPLVKSHKILIYSPIVKNHNTRISSPLYCCVIFFVLSVAIVIIEKKRNKTYLIWDMLLCVTTGIAGILLLALFVSQHPTTSTNLQILILNPLNILFVKSVYKRKKSLYWRMSAMMTILFLCFSFLQDYASGMIFVGLSLLTRNYIHMYGIKTENRHEI